MSVLKLQGASKNKAETYFLYVEHLFLRSNAVDASPTNVHPCTFVGYEFAEQTRCCSISRTSLSVLKMQKKRMRIFDTLSGGTDAARIKQKQDDMFLIAGKCGTLIRRDKGAGSRLLANARKS